MTAPDWVQEIVLDVYGNSARFKATLKPGDRALVEGRPASILSGYYFDPTYGRLSNWFTWEWDDGEEGKGYAGRWEPIP